MFDCPGAYPYLPNQDVFEYDFIRSLDSQFAFLVACFHGG